MTASAKSTWKKRIRSSLSRKTMILILVMTLLLGTAAIATGYQVYSSTLDRHTTENTIDLVRTAEVILNKEMVLYYAEEVYRIYSSLTPEEKEDEEEKYLEKYAYLTKEEGWQFIREQLQGISRENNLSSTTVVVQDREAHTIIYVVDSDITDTYCPPGKLDRTMLDEDFDHFMNGDAVITNTEEYGWLSSCAVPLIGGDGEVIGFVVADMSMNEVMKNKIHFLVSFCIALVVVMVGIGFVTAWFMRRNVVNPINRLAKAASEYTREQARVGEQHRLSAGHFSNLNIRTGDEVENLASVMGKMESDLADYIDHITRVTAEKERLGTELDIAGRIQLSMLPQTFPPYPERTEFGLYASMDPAKQVGGDFYDFFLVDDDHLCLVIADVSGKGVPAALFMMSAKAIIANNAMAGKSPAQVLADTNSALCANRQEDMFVTVWIGILEISTGKLTAANGGHEYPVLAQDGRFELHKDVHSFLVGGMEGIPYREYEIQLKPGDRLFVYTDGVPEARNSSGKMFGIPRMVEALNQRKEESPEGLLEAVRKAVDAFVGDAEQFDDLTMLCVAYKGGK